MTVGEFFVLSDKCASFFGGYTGDRVDKLGQNAVKR